MAHVANQTTVAQLKEILNKIPEHYVVTVTQESTTKQWALKFVPPSASSRMIVLNGSSEIHLIPPVRRGRPPKGSQ